MADKLWADNWRDVGTTTCEELAAALQYDCEQRGVTCPESLGSVVKYCVAQDGVVSRGEFIHFASTFGPFDVFVNRAVESLVESSTDGDAIVHKWYHGALDRKEAAAMVAAGGEGAFLIRASSRPGKLAVQFVTGGVVKNCLLYNLGARGFCLLQRPGPDDAVHQTVADFVQFGVTHGRFRAPVESRLHRLSVTDAAANAKSRQKASAGAGGSNYAAFDGGGGDYGPLPTDAGAGGGSNYAAFDLDGMDDGGPAVVAAAAPVSNYAAFDLDGDGGDPLPATDDGGAAGGSSYGMFDPDAADLGGFGSTDGPGAAADAFGPGADSSYGAFDPTSDDLLGGGGALVGETDTAGGDGGGAYGAFDPDADDLGGGGASQYTAFAAQDGDGEPSAYAAFDG